MEEKEMKDTTCNDIIVVKIGTQCNVQYGLVSKEAIRRIAKEILRLRGLGYQVIIVASGAIGVGIPLIFGDKHGLDEHEIPVFSENMPFNLKCLARTRLSLKIDEILKNRELRKVCTGAGQIELARKYFDIFRRYELAVSQILFTYKDLENKEIAAEIREFFMNCFEIGIVPLVNYNDPLNTEEIFADNDRFAAEIAVLVKARRLLIVTDKVDGLMNGGVLVRTIHIDDIEKYKKMCTSEVGKYSTGGMKTKLEAAEIVAKEGGTCYIGNIKYDMMDIILDISPSTMIYPKQSVHLRQDDELFICGWMPLEK